ncbi:hypothetical protein ACIF8W_02640 [Streptomyces sp. NPDC085639]|uniref:hypothetical protein n=1 Tax=Streptomyces sp. NPDC085639 TaxID=3365734 RepID=UPI0037D24CE1
MKHFVSAARLAAACLACAAMALTASCGSSTPYHGTDKPVALSPASSSPYRGTALENPFAKPGLVLTDTPTTFRSSPRAPADPTP